MGDSYSYNYGDDPFDPINMSWSDYIDYNGWGTAGSQSTGGSGTSFWTALSSGLNDATKILGARYAVPQLNPGQVIQTGPNGVSFMSQAQQGGSLITNSALTSLGGSSSLLLLGVGAVVLLMIMKK
jgi:hypothetical protein